MSTIGGALNVPDECKVNIPLTPTGVEHTNGQFSAVPDYPVNIPLTPTGVEHMLVPFVSAAARS